MNNIFYFTTCLDHETFEKSLPLFQYVPNLSNQNFHNKLIRAISTKYKVNVISVRSSFLKGKSTLDSGLKIEDNIEWNYIKVKQSKIDKILFLKSRINVILQKNTCKNPIFFVDTMNLSLLKSVLFLKKKYKATVIGIVTDNPLNISFLSTFYKEQLLKQGRQLDKYIALTEDLNNLYNASNKPYVLIDGITEIFDVKKEDNKPYVFFGGSLLKQYGVLNLIKAFNESDLSKYSLLIAGHHKTEELDPYLKDNVVFIGPKTYKEISILEANSICCVNPRPINPQIDSYSVPSKVLEYMANGALTISTKIDILEKHYSDSIIWSGNSTCEELKEALNKVASMSEKDRRIHIEKAQKTVLSYTGFEYIVSTIEKLFN